MGDPKTIHPYSDLYRLEFVVADEKMQENIRNTVANIRISFRYSLSEDKIPNKNSAIAYQTLNLIETQPPQTRVDPPDTFTTFLLIAMATITAIFYYGIFVHQKANINNLPKNNGMGLILNLSLIGLLVVNLVFLMKFWLAWNFLTVLSNMFWLMILTALVGNYALLHMNKQSE